MLRQWARPAFGGSIGLVNMELLNQLVPSSLLAQYYSVVLWDPSVHFVCHYCQRFLAINNCISNVSCCVFTLLLPARGAPISHNRIVCPQIASSTSTNLSTPSELTESTWVVLVEAKCLFG